MLKAFSDSNSVSNVLTTISSVSFHSPKNENNFQEEIIFLARVGRKIPENKEYVEKYMVQKKNRNMLLVLGQKQLQEYNLKQVNP